MTYKYESTSDSLLKVGSRYLRASRVESIESVPASSTGSRDVTVKMFSGVVHEFAMKSEDVDRLARQAMGE